MQPIYSTDTHPKEAKKTEYASEYSEGPSWGTIIAAIVVMALIVASAWVIAGNSEEAAPAEPVPNEESLDPSS